MGTKLVYFVLLFICITACKSTNSKVPSEKEYYIEAYKKAVLYGCLDERTSKDFTKMLVKHNDLGLYTEVQILFHSECEKAETLGANFARQLQPAHLPDAENMIPGYRDCVSYAFSKEVDSIARSAYAIRLKNPN